MVVVPWRLVAPGLCISVASALTRARCGPIRGPTNVPLRPPSWVFGVVWPLLYLTTGYAWARSRAPTIGLVVLLCCAWLYVYSCRRARTASALILLSASVLSFAASTRSAWMLPLASWTAFATYLNAYPLLRP